MFERNDEGTIWDKMDNKSELTGMEKERQKH